MSQRSALSDGCQTVDKPVNSNTSWPYGRRGHIPMVKSHIPFIATGSTLFQFWKIYCKKGRCWHKPVKKLDWKRKILNSKSAKILATFVYRSKSTVSIFFINKNILMLTYSLSSKCFMPYTLLDCSCFRELINLDFDFCIADPSFWFKGALKHIFGFPFKIPNP